MSYNAILEKYINDCPFNEPIFIDEIRDYLINNIKIENEQRFIKTINVYINRLVKDNKIVPFVKGVYYKPLKGSRNLCPESKAIPESVIKQAFMEVFYLLSNKNGLALDEFLDTIKQSLNDDTPKMMLQKKLDERKQLKTRLSKLVDLYVDGQIEKEVFERKQRRLEENLEDINKKISSLEKHQNASNTYETNINRIKNEMKSRETINKIQEFDVGLFESLVDYIIIGGYDENNVSNEFMIRFIIRNGFYFKSRNDITDEKIINNGINNKNSIYTTILDYISTQQFLVYEKGENKRIKKIINKVRVRVEIEKL